VTIPEREGETTVDLTGAHERERQAAYLYSIVQSAEESEDVLLNDVQQAYDAGIMYAANAVLKNWAGGTEWAASIPEYADEITRWLDDRLPLPDRCEQVVKAATAWRERIADHPELWADREDLALIAAVDALEAEKG
jgi:hypothetical protein